MQDQKIRILVVDDTEITRELLTEALADAGYEVEAVASGEAAIECVKRAEGDFDFIIMDQVLLGGMSGIDATRIIHQEYPQIRTIVMTIYGDGESSQAALDAEAYRYVFRSLDLKEAVDDVIALIESPRELAEIEERLPKSFWINNVCKGMQMAVGIVDRTYRVLYANEAQNAIAGGESRLGGICWVEWHQAVQQKGPCPWCPVKPLFEGKDPVVRTVPLFKQGRWQHWQTGASPILGREGQAIAALKWGVDVTEREMARVATLTAQTVTERLKATLEQIRMLGYSRARLYELSEDGATLVGRKQVGGMHKPITDIRFRLEEDPALQRALSGRVPVIHRKRERGKPRFDSEIDRAGIEEWLDVPLWTGDGDLVGGIRIDNKAVEPIRPNGPTAPRPVTEEHFESLLAIAQFAANAIWSEREYRRAVEESKLLRKLRALDTDLTQILEPEKVLQKVVQACLDLTGADSANICLREGDRLVQKSTIGRFSAVMGHDVPMSDDHIPCVWVARTGSYYLVNRAQEDKYIVEWKSKVDGSERQLLESLGSIVAYPLEVRGKTIGVLTLQSEEPDFFTNRICRIIEDFRLRAAIAIENARLFEQIQTQAKERAETFGEIAHQLYTPLTSMKVPTDMLADGIIKDPEQLQEYYRIVAAATEEAIRMATDILNLRRIEAGVFDLLRKEVSLSELIQKVVQLFRFSAAAMGIEIEEVFNHSVEYIYADEDKMTAALQTLLENAISFSERGSRVTISTASDREAVYSSVKDSGYGIPEDELPHIFDKYFRGRIAREKVIDGVGIGLTIARHVVEQHGGRISVDSQLGEGSTFTIELPLREPGGDKQ